jgi:hypothetical protein
MGCKFCTIRFKDQVGLGSGFISSHFWTIIYLGPWHFVKNHMDHNPLPPLHIAETDFFIYMVTLTRDTFSRRSWVLPLPLPRINDSGSKRADRDRSQCSVHDGAKVRFCVYLRTAVRGAGAHFSWNGSNKSQLFSPFLFCTKNIQVCDTE